LLNKDFTVWIGTIVSVIGIIPSAVAVISHDRKEYQEQDRKIDNNATDSPETS
jgi:hypothetical protein